jgi:hypothetical protein
MGMKALYASWLVLQILLLVAAWRKRYDEAVLAPAMVHDDALMLAGGDPHHAGACEWYVCLQRCPAVGSEEGEGMPEVTAPTPRQRARPA